MNIDWQIFRKEELKNWKFELEEEQKRLELEMEKQQKIREKYLLRWQVAETVKDQVSQATFENGIGPYQRKKDQINQEVRAKLHDLMQQLELIEAFKHVIEIGLTTDLENLVPAPQPSKVKLTKDKLHKKKTLKRKWHPQPQN